VFDSTAAFAQQAREGAAAAAAAMSAGMAAAGDRRGRYEAAMSPLGASYGDAMMLPVVPEDATAPASDFLFAQGDQPGRGT